MSFPFIKARLNLTFVFAEQRRRDRDNLLARFKPGLDAIVDAELLLDDDAEHLQIGKVDILVDPGRAPLTIIELKEETICPCLTPGNAIFAAKKDQTTRYP